MCAVSNPSFARRWRVPVALSQSLKVLITFCCLVEIIMSSPGQDHGVTRCCDVLGRAALISAGALAQHTKPRAPSDTSTPNPLPLALFSCCCSKSQDQYRYPSDPISSFLLLSIYTIYPFLALADNLLAGFAASADSGRGRQGHLFVPRSRLRLQC